MEEIRTPSDDLLGSDGPWQLEQASAGTEAVSWATGAQVSMDQRWGWRREASRAGMRNSNVRPPLLTPSLCKKSPISPPRSQDCWGSTQLPDLGPGRAAPLHLAKPLPSFIQSLGTYWLPSQCQVLGIAATLSSLWSRLLSQSCAATPASRPTPDPLSLHWPTSCGTLTPPSFLPVFTR